MRKGDTLQLTPFKRKTSGKNGGELDGFYSDQNNNKYFIKQPQDFSEFFAELLAGKLIQYFKDHNFIPKNYHDSLIAAGLTRFTGAQLENPFALIQPAVEMTELFKELKTGSYFSKDRSNFWEMLFGKEQYSKPFSEGNEYFGLSYAIMISILLYDFTFHSGNVARLNKTNQYVKFDFGSAFYKFVHPESHNDVLFSKEYESTYKYIKKNYISYYACIPGFLDAVQKKAEDFHSNINETNLNSIFTDIVRQCLKDIPTDFLERLSKKDMRHFGFSEDDLKDFETNRNQFFEKCFIPKFGMTLALRLEKLVKLSEESPTYQPCKNKSMNLYHSVNRPSRMQGVSTQQPQDPERKPRWDWDPLGFFSLFSLGSSSSDSQSSKSNSNEFGK